MLSWSAHKTDREVDLAAIGKPSLDPLLEGGRALVDYVASGLGADDHLLRSYAALTDELGSMATTRAAAVLAAFEMFNRVADGIGVPVTRARREKSVRAISELGLEDIAH